MLFACIIVLPIGLYKGAALYLSAKELAEKWGVDRSLVLRHAKNGRIEGAVQFGSNWMFPADAQKPIDCRGKRDATFLSKKGAFRFPIYLNFEENAYRPSLTEEERLLRLAQIDFHACRFAEAIEKLIPLSERAENRYARISALYYLCFASIYGDDGNFDATQRMLNDELSKDFPYKKEMMLFRYMLDANLGFYKPILDDFGIDPEYRYHPSAYHALSLVSIIPIENGDFSILSRLRYDTYELICQQMEHDGHFIEAQKLHYLLLVLYQLKQDKDRMLFHTRKGLEIAVEREFYWYAATYEHFYPNITRKALEDFPQEFSDTIHALGNAFQKKIVRFDLSLKNQTYFTLLSNKEYEYAFLANQGYTNRQIASKLHVSEKTVSKRYNEIYVKLGVKSKAELVAFINNTHGSMSYAD